MATLPAVPIPIHFEVKTDLYYLTQRLVITPLLEMTTEEKRNFDSLCCEAEKIIYRDILRLDWRLKV